MDIEKINFIKKSSVNFEEKIEKVMIYRERGENDFHYVFDCPKCGKHNDFANPLKIEKKKEKGKSKELYIFNCRFCGQDYSVERFKPPRGSGK